MRGWTRQEGLGLGRLSTQVSRFLAFKFPEIRKLDQHIREFCALDQKRVIGTSLLLLRVTGQ
eukprot:2445124-Rhodomonas_salina.1